MVVIYKRIPSNLSSTTSNHQTDLVEHAALSTLKLPSMATNTNSL